MSVNADVTTDLVITELYYPESPDSRHVDWEELGFFTPGEGDGDGTAYATLEVIRVEYRHETYSILARNNLAAGLVVDGRVFTSDELDEQVEEAEADAFDPEGQTDVSEDPGVVRWSDRASALVYYQRHGLRDSGAEGPMMNYFYPVSGYVRGSLEEWATAIADLPLCVVVLDTPVRDSYGLALTGGGMDLSWEIAEAFIRCGYYPPTWIDLPADADGINPKRKAIATALATHYQAMTLRMARKTKELTDRYGITPLSE